MCRKLALAATALTLVFGPAASAAEAPTRQARGKANPAPDSASAAHRAQADRSDPLTASVFWSAQFEANEKDEEAGLKLAAALRILGRYDQAAETAQKVTTINPRNVEALLETARAFLGAGNGFYAIEPARKAQALAPRDWRPISLLAVAYEQTQRPQEAEAAYRQAMSLSPANPAVLNNLAMFRAAQGEAAEAEKLLRQAAAQPGATAQIRQNLSLVLGLQGRLSEAEALLRQDLPPNLVDNNLAYLRAATANEPKRTPATNTRSWDSLRAPTTGG